MYSVRTAGGNQLAPRFQSQSVHKPLSLSNNIMRYTYDINKLTDVQTYTAQKTYRQICDPAEILVTLRSH